MRADDTAKRLMTVPGIGVICATAMEALAPPPESFAKGRDFAAWLGLTPKQNSSGGKTKLGGTSKMGQRDLRRLLVSGAIAQVRCTKRRARGILACANDEKEAALRRRCRSRKPHGADRVGSDDHRWGLSSFKSSQRLKSAELV